MTDLFLKIGLNNALFSLGLAILAMIAGAKGRRARLAYMLWLLVFIKLVTPPIISLPVLSLPEPVGAGLNEPLQPGAAFVRNSEFTVDGETDASASMGIALAAVRYVREWFPPVWLLGSVVVFCGSFVRVLRFMRLLSGESKAAPDEIQSAATKIGRRLGLRRVPAICITSARLSPLVWWVGGKVRIVLPATLLETMDSEQWRWVLAHELAHVRRRDHLVRWLEWLACILFWWNPVVWWAQRNLRAAEEICCDELVVSSLKAERKFYANSLLSAVEFLARPVVRAPAMASEINSGGFLERRFKMIVSDNSKRTNCRWLQICVLLCAVVVLPLRIASAADYEAVGKRLKAAVEAGELTAEESRIMMGALRRGAMAEGGDKSITVEEYKRAEAKMRKMVEEGKAKPEDVERRLIEMRKMIGDKDKSSGRGITPEEYKRAEAKMRKMVEAGEAKPEDVERRLTEMRIIMAERGERGRGEKGITVAEYKRAEAQMRKMVEDGQAKPEDVERRLSRMRLIMAERGERGGKEGDPKAEYDAAARKIKAAIKAGEITEEQGKARLEGMKKMLASRRVRGEKDVDWEAVKKRIEAAVKSGKMTRKEADAKYEEIKKQMAGGSKRTGRENYSETAREIREAVAAGKLTKEQGREKLAAIRKQIAAKKEAPARKKSREGQAKKDVDWEAVKKKIEAAVKSGKITRKEADAKYEAIKKQMAGGDKR